MKYELAKPARPTCPHNRRAWARIQPLLAEGPADLRDLMLAIGTHKPPPSRETGNSSRNCLAFILYCVERGWLREVL